MGNENSQSTKHAVLTCLRHAAAPVSGEELAATCGVTRVSVWKAIQKLQEAGYGITGSRAGYVLTADKSDSLDSWEFENRESQFIHFDETDSTMIEARRIAENGEAGMQIITADSQTAGRGRADRSWTTTTGSLAFTLVTDTRLPVAESHRAVMASQLAVLHTLQEANPSKQFFLRWPNDIWTADGKVCGILDEFRASGSYTQWLNLGIGVNLHTAPDGADYVSSSTDLTRKTLLESFLDQYQRIQPLIQEQSSQLTDRWNAACRDTGSTIRLDDGTSCTFLGLNSYGWAQTVSNGNTTLFPPGTARYIK
ncbi:MAG: biotin--[acetyl-CoA-carboxylase] ligase [Treponemataceae bacterium]|nr:biotin--[acetyl-CoA-carboxylase] ligase [Treponemataceae bacterium]